MAKKCAKKRDTREFSPIPNFKWLSQEVKIIAGVSSVVNGSAIRYVLG